MDPANIVEYTERTWFCQTDGGILKRTEGWTRWKHYTTPIPPPTPPPPTPTPTHPHPSQPNPPTPPTPRLGHEKLNDITACDVQSQVIAL